MPARPRQLCRAERSRDTPRTQAAPASPAACVRGVSRDRPPRSGGIGGPRPDAAYRSLSSPLLRVSELKLCPCPPSPTFPIPRVSRLRLALSAHAFWYFRPGWTGAMLGHRPQRPAGLARGEHPLLRCRPGQAADDTDTPTQAAPASPAACVRGVSRDRPPRSGGIGGPCPDAAYRSCRLRYSASPS